MAQRRLDGYESTVFIVGSSGILERLKKERGNGLPRYGWMCPDLRAKIKLCVRCLRKYIWLIESSLDFEAKLPICLLCVVQESA